MDVVEYVNKNVYLWAEIRRTILAIVYLYTREIHTIYTYVGRYTL